MTNPVVEKVAKAIARIDRPTTSWEQSHEHEEIAREQAKTAIGALHGVMNDVPKVGMGDRLLWENALTRIETFIATGK